jgi:thiamine-phosphate pyrophosphorylase
MQTRAERIARLAKARLYCCTDAHGSVEDFEAFVEDLFSSGVDIVQFRDKSMEPLQAMAYIEVLREAALRHGALSCVNDRADIAAVTGVDIVHVGQDDLTPAQARGVVGDEMLIGRSTHAIEESLAAAADHEVDYFAVGPVWPTPTKPGRAAPGLALVRQVASANVSMPWFAIGGIDAPHAREVLAAGASRIVVVRALTAAASPSEAARELRALLADQPH